MEEKQWLVEGFCPTDEYRCLMPVAYEPMEEHGIVTSYRKKRMACRHVEKEGCAEEANCPFFRTAPEQLEKNTEWYR